MFKKYYYPPVNFWSVWFSEIVIRCLKNNKRKINKDDVILDIGCGLGNHCFSLIAFSPKEIHGFDISKDTINLLKTFTEKIEFRNFDICSEDISQLKNKFSVVFSCDVYEHVNNPQQMLDNIYAVLANGGEVSITFPNFENHGHNQITDLSDFKASISKAGFKQHKVDIIKDRTLIYRIFTKFYEILQDISDKIYGIKRNPNRMPDSDEFHEMYAFEKINKLKDKKFLIFIINFVYNIMKKFGRLSSVYILSENSQDVMNKRIVFWAKK
jgi:2-polyprenyl-3-methyl-5-hydroxy-6-metoxy-1,4-benzoquinol methylase